MAAEVELNKTVIDRVADIELRLAEEMLEDWEQIARAQAQRNVLELSQSTPV